MILRYTTGIRRNKWLVTIDLSRRQSNSSCRIVRDCSNIRYTKHYHESNLSFIIKLSNEASSQSGTQARACQEKQETELFHPSHQGGGGEIKSQELLGGTRSKSIGSVRVDYFIRARVLPSRMAIQDQHGHEIRPRLDQGRIRGRCQGTEKTRRKSPSSRWLGHHACLDQDGEFRVGPRRVEVITETGNMTMKSVSEIPKNGAPKTMTRTRLCSIWIPIWSIKTIQQDSATN
jgi:hypothetical protein